MFAFNVPKRRPGLTRVELAVVIVVGLTVALLLMPAQQRVADSSTRAQSTNNLKNISLAAHSFHDANKRLPFNGVSADTLLDKVRYRQMAVGGEFTSGSWGFQISSYCDQQEMFAAGSTQTRIYAYMEHARDRPGLDANGNPWSDYVINPWLNDPKAGDFAINVDSKLTLVEITDGRSNTILFGQGAVNTWDYGTTVITPGYLDTVLKGGTGATAQSTNRMARDASDTPRDATRGWGGPYSQGCLFCMGDATVRMFPYALNGAGLQPFLTPNGKEDVELPDT